MSDYPLQKRGGRYRIIDPSTDEPARGRNGPLDGGGWEDWHEARLGRQEVHLKEERHKAVQKGFITRARERFNIAKMRGRDPDPSDLKMLSEGGQLDEGGGLVPEASE